MRPTIPDQILDLVLCALVSAMVWDFTQYFIL